MCQHPGMDALTAAARWAETWTRAWPAGDTDAIAALYADEATYRALAFRAPDLGSPACALPRANFAVETQTECWFGEPLVAGDRAAVEWWGTWVEEGRRLTLAARRSSGSTATAGRRSPRLLERGRRREPPYAGW